MLSFSPPGIGLSSSAVTDGSPTPQSLNAPLGHELIEVVGQGTAGHPQFHGQVAREGLPPALDGGQELFDPFVGTVNSLPPFIPLLVGLGLGDRSGGSFGGPGQGGHTMWGRFGGRGSRVGCLAAKQALEEPPQRILSHKAPLKSENQSLELGYMGWMGSGRTHLLLHFSKNPYPSPAILPIYNAVIKPLGFPRRQPGRPVLLLGMTTK